MAAMSLALNAVVPSSPILSRSIRFLCIYTPHLGLFSSPLSSCSSTHFSTHILIWAFSAFEINTQTLSSQRWRTLWSSRMSIAIMSSQLATRSIARTMARAWRPMSAPWTRKTWREWERLSSSRSVYVELAIQQSMDADIPIRETFVCRQTWLSSHWPWALGRLC